MYVDLLGDSAADAQIESNKKAGTKVLVPAVSWLVCPDKLRRRAGVSGAGARSRNPGRAVAAKDLYSLRGPSRPQSQVPHLGQDARHLHSIQLRNKRQDFRDELIFHQLADFVLAVLFPATEQFRHGHLQGSSQPLQGRQRGRGFLVFNFRNVGSRHGHASGQLPLAQPAAQAQRADGGREVQVPTAHPGHGIITGGVITTGSGSGSSSRDEWQRRQLLLTVRN